ncbi:MAG: hypothetical protein GC189_10390 [Alphaproteobacteria bacterium]|nr:hypothetical protein [Alphaproteobacteria bacterium]
MAIDAQAIWQVVLLFMGALAGALFGGVIRWSGTRRERRLRLTMDFYSEFHSPAFNHIRILAHDALQNAPSMPAAYAASSGETRDAIASIVHFWERVAVLMQEGALNPRLTRRFFAQYARWWSETLCDKGGLDDPEWGRTLSDIHGLFRKLAHARPKGARP